MTRPMNYKGWTIERGIFSKQYWADPTVAITTEQRISGATLEAVMAQIDSLV